MTAVTAPADDAVASTPRLRLAYIDVLRALCALYVVVQHTWLTVDYWELDHGRRYDAVMANATSWMAFGYYAVTAFIVLSGFSLAASVRSSRFRRPADVASYLLRRARRLVPPYWAALVIAAVTGAYVVSTPTFTLWDQVLPVTGHDVAVQAALLQDVLHVRLTNYAFWSIAIEWHIYFLFPVLVLAFRRYGIIRATAGAIVLSTVVDLVARGTRWEGLTPLYVGYFALGMLALDVVRTGRWPRVPWLPLSLLCFGSVAVIQTAGGFVWAVGQRRHLEPLIALGVVCLVIWLGHRAAGSALTPHRLSRPQLWLGSLGTFSYSLYLIHAPLLALEWKYGFSHLGLSAWQDLLLLQTVGVAVIIAIAWGFYWLVERPCLPPSTRAAQARERGAVAVG